MKITGVDDVLANLRKLDSQMQGAAMKQALGAAALIAEGTVKANAREEFYTGASRGQTGNLLNSIASKAVSDKEAVVYVGAEYGVYLEMGTSRGIRPRKYVYRGVYEHLAPIGQAAVTTLKRILGT